VVLVLSVCRMGVVETGEGATGVEVRGVDTEAGAGPCEGSMRRRFGSGGLVPLSCEANDCSLVAPEGDSTVSGGEESRFRLLFAGVRAFDFLLELGGVLKDISMSLSAAPLMRFVASSSSFASSLA
jgi:hypothetical protein